MNRFKFVSLIVVSVVIAVLLATALSSFTRVSDSALAEVAIPRANAGAGSSRPSTAGTNYLPIIFLNSATAGGAWLLGGNAGTDSLTDFLGTTDNMTLTFRVSNTVAYRIVPAADPTFGFAPNLIGGSPDNRVSPGLYGATIAGGGVPNYPNVITGTGNYATIAGGGANTASGDTASVGGGYGNTASGSIATIGGGQGNTASGSVATVGGGGANAASGDAAFVGGGYYNTASITYTTVGGGFYNTASGLNATVGGGYLNTASGNYTTVGGGQGNTASGNTARGHYETVGGGLNNTASRLAATVSGGSGNTASGYAATIPGGEHNVASGANSFAAGTQAQALHQGSFVWADSNGGNFSSTASDQFLVQANGGVGIGTNNPGAYAMTVQRNGGIGQYQVGRFKNGSTSGDKSTIVDWETGDTIPQVWRVSVGGAGNGLGLTAGQLYFEHSGVALQIDANHDFHLYPSGGGSCNLTSGAGWNCSSDRNLKENIVRANGEEILARVAELPVSTWNMKGTDVTHIGPMAQDFYAAFNVGEDDKHINTVDAQGVALAAIQGLALENKAQAKELTELRETNRAFATRLAALEQNTPSNALALNALAPWAVVGLVAVWAMRRRRGTGA